MSRRMIIAVAVCTLLVVSLAAVAAVTTGGAPSVTVTPQVHRNGDQGYFRIVVQLPHGAPTAPPALVPHVDEGDLYLVNALAAQTGNDVDDEAEEEGDGAHTGQEMTVTGRFGHPGPARLTILARSAGGSPKPLMTLAFNLPEGDSANPEVRTEWARQQQIVLSSADPEARDSFSHYWQRVIAPQ